MQSVILSISVESKACGGLFNLGGELIGGLVEDSLVGGLSQRCKSVAERIFSSYDRERYKVVAIAVASKGFVKDGVVKGKVEDLRGENLRSFLESQFRIPTQVVNRFHAAALGASRDLRYRTEEALSVVNISTGVGAGTVIRGRLKEDYDAQNGVGGLQRVRRLSDGQYLPIASIAGISALRTRMQGISRNGGFGVLFSQDPRYQLILNDAVDAVAELIVSLDKNYRPTKILGLVFKDEALPAESRQAFIDKVSAAIKKKVGRCAPIELFNEESEALLKLKGAAKIAQQQLHENVLVITGLPGTGKTTSAQKTLQALREAGLKVGGMTCGETRGKSHSNGARTGFSMTLFSPDKEEKVVDLALIGTVQGRDWKPMSRYSVNVGNIEDVAVPALRKALKEADVLLVDELASMQLLSSRLEDTVKDLIGSGKPLILTIPANSRNGLVQEVRKKADQKGQLFSVKRGDSQSMQRDQKALSDRIVDLVKAMLRQPSTISLARDKMAEPASSSKLKRERDEGDDREAEERSEKRPASSNVKNLNQTK